MTVTGLVHSAAGLISGPLIWIKSDAVGPPTDAEFTTAGVATISDGLICLNTLSGVTYVRSNSLYQPYPIRQQSPYTYTFWSDGTNYHADSMAGLTDYSGTDAFTVLESAKAAIIGSATGAGTIFAKANSGIVMSSKFPSTDVSTKILLLGEGLGTTFTNGGGAYDAIDATKIRCRDFTIQDQNGVTCDFSVHSQQQTDRLWSVPIRPSTDATNPAHSTLTYLGNYARIQCLGAFSPAFKTTLALLNKNVPSANLRMQATVRAGAANFQYYSFFAEKIKSDFADFIGFRVSPGTGYEMMTRFKGNETKTTYNGTIDTNDHTYLIYYNRTQVQFVLDGTLRATHTTNIPPPPFEWEACEPNGVAGTVYLKHPYIALFEDDPGGTLGTIPQAFSPYSAVGLSALVSNAVNFTPPASAGTYRIGVYVNVHTAAAVNMAVTVTYKDAGGNAQSELVPLQQQNTTTTVNNMNNTAGRFTGQYIFQIDNSATAITVSTTGTTQTLYDLAIVPELII